MAEKKQRRRPFGVYVIIFLQLLGILSSLIIFAVEYAAYKYPELNIELDFAKSLYGPDFWITNFEMLIVTCLSLVSIIGLWRMQRWAWYLTMLELGFSMVVDIAGFFNGNPNNIDLLLNVLMVFYLNQKDVQRAFVRRRVEAA